MARPYIRQSIGSITYKCLSFKKRTKNHGYHESIKYDDERYSLAIELNSDVQDTKIILNKTQTKVEDVKNLIDLYKNHYLAEEYYDWAVEEREQLQKKVMQFLDKFVMNMDAKTDSVLKEAIDKLIEIDPWEERFTVLQVQFYILQGNHRAAIDTYNRYKSNLWDQLGIKPQEKLVNLIKNI